MPLKVRCSHCSATLVAAEDEAGQDRPCPRCGALVSVPALDALGQPGVHAVRISEQARAWSQRRPEGPGLSHASLPVRKRFSMLPMRVRIGLLVLMISLPVLLLIGVTVLSRLLPGPSAAPASGGAVVSAGEDPDVRARETLYALLTGELSEYQVRQEYESERGVLVRAIATAFEREQVFRGPENLLLTARHRSELIAMVLALSERGPMPPQTEGLALRAIQDSATRSDAALLLAAIRSPAAAEPLVAELVVIARDLQFLRLREPLETQHAAALRQQVQTMQARAARLRQALSRVPQAAQRQLLVHYWNAMQWLGPPGENPIVAELRSIRSQGSAAEFDTALLGLIDDDALPGPLRLAGLAAYSILLEPGERARQQLAGYAVELLSDPQERTRQRAVWVIALLTGRQFGAFNAANIPEQVGEQVLQACREWVNQLYRPGGSGGGA